MTIDDQWQSWQDNTDLSKVPDIDTETLKQTIIKDLTFVSAMTVQEYTLYQKFQEVKFRYPTAETNSFFDKYLPLNIRNNFNNVRFYLLFNKTYKKTSQTK